MPPKHPSEDREFTGLSQRFQRNIYASAKGQLRLAILARDFKAHLPERPMRILDIGAGHGHWSLALAQQGHHVTLVEPSAEMLEHARDQYGLLKEQGVAMGAVTFRECRLQEYSESDVSTYDVVMCHAVLEWLSQPEEAFTQLLQWLRPGGFLSVIVYNLNGLIMKNLLRTNYRKILEKDFTGTRGSLTPLQPLLPEQLQAWINNSGLSLTCYSGIRTFHDYVLDPLDRAREEDKVRDLELEYSRKEPFRSLGRYLHFLCQSPAG